MEAARFVRLAVDTDVHAVGNLNVLVEDDVAQHSVASDSRIVHDHTAVDRGMVKGMLAALYGGDAEPSLQASLPQGDTFCATAVF